MEGRADLIGVVVAVSLHWEHRVEVIFSCNWPSELSQVLHLLVLMLEVLVIFEQVG